jgi:hypothetical protein
LTALTAVNVEFVRIRPFCSTFSAENVTSIARFEPDVTFAALSEANVTSARISAFRVTFSSLSRRANPRSPSMPPFSGAGHLKHVRTERTP